jgi:hypothetical protein
VSATVVLASLNGEGRRVRMKTLIVLFMVGLIVVGLFILGLLLLHGTAVAPPRLYRVGSLSQMTGSISGAIIKSRFSPSDVARLHANGVQKVLNYEQTFALNSSEASFARSNGWPALTCTGREIHPKNIPGVVLMDALDPGARAWRATTIAGETNAKGADGTYLDTLRAFFPESFYDGVPCDGLTSEARDEAWRAASVEMILLVKASTPDRSYLVANGAGLGTGSAYLTHEAAAQTLVVAADAVQMEHYLRSSRRKVEDNAVITKWNALDADAWALCDTADDATCKSAFAEVESARNYLDVVD